MLRQEQWLELTLMSSTMRHSIRNALWGAKSLTRTPTKRNPAFTNARTVHTQTLTPLCHMLTEETLNRSQVEEAAKVFRSNQISFM